MTDVDIAILNLCYTVVGLVAGTLGGITIGIIMERTRND
jgi:hypothetical protein